MTPNGIFFEGDVELVTVKTSVGYIGLQHGKSPFVASLDHASIEIKHEKHKKISAISGGIVYANPESINIITDAIENKEKIDLARAKLAKKEAEARLKQKLDKAEMLIAQQALQRAVNRINVGKEK